MDLEKARQYRQEIKDLLAIEPDQNIRRNFLRELRNDPHNLEAKRTVQLFRNASETTKKPQQGLAFDVFSDQRQEPLNRALTEEEQTREWARSIEQEYNALPSVGSQAKKAKGQLISTVAKSLLEDPQKIVTAGSVWQIHAVDTNQGKFYGELQKETKKELGKQWDSITRERLAKLIQSHTYGELTKGFTTTLLKEYFKAPTNRIQRVDAYYTFVYSLLELLQDNRALDQGVRVAMYESDIITRDSDFYVDFLVATNTVDDDRLLGKAHTADNIALALCPMTSLSGEEALARANAHNSEQTRNPESKTMRRLQSAFDKAAKKMGPGEVHRRMLLLQRLLAVNEPITVDTKNPSIPAEWPYKIWFGLNDPLRKDFQRKVGARVLADQTRQVIISELKKDGVEKLASFSFSLPNGLIFEGVVAGEMNPQKKAAIIRRSLDRKLDFTDLLSHNHAISIPSLLDSDELNGDRFFFFIRPASELEQQQHPIAALAEVGFPVPVFKDGDEVIKKKLILQEAVLARQSRYLNKRGFIVPLLSQAFRELGYQSVTFSQAESIYDTIASIKANDLTYEVKLDQHLNFNFEGKSVGDSAFEQSLHYTILALLEPILCADPKGVGGRLEKEPEDQVMTRVGHLAWLPEGQAYTSRAMRLYQQDTGKDLETQQFTRWDAYPQRINQYTTYRSPVFKSAEDLDPIEFRVVKIPGFTE